MMLGRSGGDIGNAYIDVLDVQIDANLNYYIPIYYHLPGGRGDSISECSALVRPFRKLMEEGKPIGKTAFLFYRENNVYHVLGSFAFTDRTIFFPGLTFSRVAHTPDDRDLTSDEVDDIEHFTLEKNFVDWHVRLSDRNKKYHKLKTKKINDNVMLWFVMAISDRHKLELMPKIREYELKALHQQDLERRRDLMLDSINGSIFPVTEISYTPDSPHFLNFEFFISNRKSKELDLPKGLFVMPPPFSKPDGLDRGIRSKAVYDFSLKENMAISIRTSKIKGSLKYPGVYFSGGGYQYPI
jgi:hypothetical protein